MQEQIISFETAKLLKEAGFDIPVIYYYINDGKIQLVGNTYSSEYDCECKFTFLKENWNRYGDGIYSAPTQCLAQKWLREKYSIYVIILPRIDEHKNVKYFVQVIKRQDKESLLFTTLYEKYHINTYEEALEKGLQEALKLIKDGTIQSKMA